MDGFCTVLYVLFTWRESPLSHLVVLSRGHRGPWQLCSHLTPSLPPGMFGRSQGPECVMRTARATLSPCSGAGVLASSARRRPAQPHPSSVSVSLSPAPAEPPPPAASVFCFCFRSNHTHLLMEWQATPGPLHFSEASGFMFINSSRRWTGLARSAQGVALGTPGCPPSAGPPGCVALLCSRYGPVSL